MSGAVVGAACSAAFAFVVLSVSTLEPGIRSLLCDVLLCLHQPRHAAEHRTKAQPYKVQPYTQRICQSTSSVKPVCTVNPLPVYWPVIRTPRPLFRGSRLNPFVSLIALLNIAGIVSCILGMMS